jgi:hypothetical protein
VPKEDRQQLLAEAGVTVEIDTTQALAIKADLAIPWYRIRIQKMLAKTCLYFRWLKSWNVTMASEGRQRELAQELTDGVSGEYVLFSFHV